MQYLKLYGAQLAALGYRICFLIPPGSKGPRRPGYAEGSKPAPPNWWRVGPVNGSADDGVEYSLAAHTPAIDVISTCSTRVSRRRCKKRSRRFSVHSPTSASAARPKFLIPFSLRDEPFKGKLSSAVYVDPLTGDEHRSGCGAGRPGQQWVAYHEHPGTRQPYDWTRGVRLLDLPREQLPVLDT